MKILNGLARPAVRFPRQKILGLAALLGASWALLGLLAYQRVSRADASTGINSATPASTPMPGFAVDGPIAPSPEITLSKVGPWGQLQLVPIMLELPDEYATASSAAANHDTWNFAGMNRETAIAFLASCGLTAGQLDEARRLTWVEFGTSVRVVPSDEFILSLVPDVRAMLYARLMADPANKSAIDPSWLDVGRLDFRLRGSGLSDTTTALLKRLLYPGEDGALLFNDIKPVLRAITDAGEQVRFLKAITRKRSLMARLNVTADTDTAAFAKYWGNGGREKELVPLLDSLKFNAIAGIENPTRINIASLLPPFVQERLYRHADAPLPGAVQEDCYWTAFNFFSAVPDDRVQDMSYLIGVLQRDYVKLDAPGRLGDVILLTNAAGDVLHAANYIADDVVFTKNGISGRQPWILAPMQDMLRTYRIKNATLNVAYFRRKS